MDLVHDRASVIAEEDRISNLPDEIIYHILSFLDMKYAILTSKLSRKWKHIWTSMPHLNLSSHTFRTLPQFAKFVKHALSRRNNHIEVSAAELTLRGAATQFVVRSIVSYAYSHNVRQLTMEWFTMKVFEFPQYLFRSRTLKHLTLAIRQPYCDTLGRLPNSAWDFPALETLNLSYMKFGDDRDKSLNLFSKCVNLKDLTLHQFSMCGLDIFNVCAPQLSNLTITSPVVFPKVFNVVASQLKNLVASVGDIKYSKALQLSTEGFDSLEKVNLSLKTYGYNNRRYAPGLLNLFQKLCSAKFLILDVGIIESLSSCLDQLSHELCPFNSLKCLKIDTEWLKLTDLRETMLTQVSNYLLESSPSATFIMDLPQEYNFLSNHPQKRSRQQVDMGTVAKKAAKLEAEKQPPETMAEEKRMLEAKIRMQDAAGHKQKNPETHELPSLISTWQDMHRQPMSGWVNEATRLDHERLVAEKDTQTQRDASSPGSSTSVNETEIFKKVLGERHGHIRGQGRKLKGGTSLVGQMSQPAPQSTAPPDMVDRHVLQRLVDRHNAFAEQTHTVVQNLIDNLKAAFPIVPIDPVPPPSYWTVDEFIVDPADDATTIDHNQPKSSADDATTNGHNQPNLGDN